MSTVEEALADALLEIQDAIAANTADRQQMRPLREQFRRNVAQAAVDAGPYVDVAALLAGGLERRKPDAGAVRSDGERMLYRATVNGLVGLPEAGKGLIATAMAIDELRLGSDGDEGRVLWIDADSNGAGAIVEKLVAARVGDAVLTDATRFRLVEAEDADTVREMVADSKTWLPTLVIIDSVTELIRMLGGNPNADVDYLAAHNEFLRPFRNLGAAVLAIDHAAKTSADTGFASGATQKKAKVDGAYYGVKVVETFEPGKGGATALSILKDRHGGIRATTPSRTASVFRLDSRDNGFTWDFHRGRSDEGRDASQADADVAFVLALEPFPTSRASLQAAVRAKSDTGRGWRDDRASMALTAARARRGDLSTLPLTTDHKETP